MDHEAMAVRFVDWARQRYGVFHHRDGAIWLGADELNHEQIANVVEQWAESEGSAMARPDAYAVAFYAAKWLEDRA